MAEQHHKMLLISICVVWFNDNEKKTLMMSVFEFQGLLSTFCKAMILVAHDILNISLELDWQCIHKLKQMLIVQNNESNWSVVDVKHPDSQSGKQRKHGRDQFLRPFTPTQLLHDNDSVKMVILKTNGPK